MADSPGRRPRRAPQRWSEAPELERVAEPTSRSASDGSFEDTSPSLTDFIETEYSKQVAFAAAILGSHSDAEDAVQEALLRVLPRWKRVSRYEYPAGYLRLAVLHRCYTMRRRLRRRSERETAAAGATSRQAPSEPESGGIDELLSDLSRRQREIITLRYVDDLDVQQIATLLGIAPSSVKTHLGRARKTLERTLERAEERDE